MYRYVTFQLAAVELLLICNRLGLHTDKLKLRKFLTMLGDSDEGLQTGVTAVETFTPPECCEPLLVTAYEGKENVVKIWHAEQQHFICQLEVPTEKGDLQRYGGKVVSIAAFEWQNEGFLLTGAEDGPIDRTVRLWKWIALGNSTQDDTGSPMKVASHHNGRFEQVYCIKNDPRWFTLTVSAIHVLKIVPFNPSDSGMALEYNGQGGYTPNEEPEVRVEVPNSPWFIFGSYDKSCGVWVFDNDKDLSSRTMRQLFKIRDDVVNVSHTDLILSVTAFQEGTDITVITASWDKTLRYWKFFWHVRDQCWAFNDTLQYHKVIRQHKKSVTSVVAHTFRTAYEILEESDSENDISLSRRRPRRFYTSKVLITGSLDTTAIVWDLESGEIIRKLEGHDDKITCVRVHDTEMKGLPPLVLTSSDDQSIIFWNLLTGAKIRKMDYSARISSLSILPAAKGFVVAAGASDAQVLLLNLQRVEHIRRLDTDAVTAIDCFYPRPEEMHERQPMVAIGCIDNTCSIYDYRSGAMIGKLAKHTKRINATVIYTPRDAQQPPLAITCAADKEIRVWNLFTMECVKTLQGHTESVFAVAVYNPDLCIGVHGASPQFDHCESFTPSASDLDLHEPWIISGGRDSRFLIWNLLDPQDTSPRVRKDNAHKGWIRFISVYHPTNGSEPLFATASYDTTVSLWSVRTQERLLVFEGVHKGYIFGTAIYDPLTHYRCSQEALPPNNCCPLLITGSYDSTTVVWDLNSGEKLRRMRGHTESVTALSVYSPEQSGDPLLVTCSIDKLVIVWNLLTGERLQTLVGHTDRVCFVTVFAPPPLPSTSLTPHHTRRRKKHMMDFPTVISGGDDKMNIIWEDVLYQRKIMPLRDNINRAFAFDLKEEDWPMITYFAREFDGLIFLENPHLFHLAVRYERPDFLLKFRTYLTKVLPYMNRYDDRIPLIRKPTSSLDQLAEANADFTCLPTCCTKSKAVRKLRHSFMTPLSEIERLNAEAQAAEDERDARHKNILYHAIVKNDLISVRAVLLSWTEIINTDIHDLLSQRLYHPCYFFPDHDLFKLASVYPLEFMRFVTSLRLIRNHKSMLGNVKMKRLNQRDRLEVTGAMTRVSGFDTTWKARFDRENHTWLRILDFFERIFLDRLSDAQPITSLMVPLRRTANLANSLKLYVEVCTQLSDVQLFDSEVGMMSLQYCWEEYGRLGHLLSSLVYSSFLGLFILCVYSFQFYYRRSQGFAAYIAINVFNCVVIAGFLWYGVEELAQIKARFQVVTLRTIGLHLVRDLWNAMDLFIILSGLSGMLLRVVLQRESDSGRVLLAVCSVLMWFKVLYYMRPFSNSGPLGKHLFKSLSDT